MNLKRVVITGLGSLTPIGHTVEQTWNSMLTGVSGTEVITYFDPSRFKCQIACELKGYNVSNYFDRKEARKMDPFTQYGMIAAEEAINDAHLEDGSVDKDRVAVVWGSGIGGVRNFQDGCEDYANGGRIPRFSPFFVPKTIVDIVPGHISINHGFKGANYATAAACASSAVAIANAMDIVRYGRAKVVVTGGSEAAVTEAGIGGFSSMQALSTRNSDPHTASRPFDKDRDGFVLGEGAASIVLEELEHAKARGAKIYAEVVGYGMSADAYHITASHPEGEGARRAMQLAVEDAGMDLHQVDHINTHGTSTPLGDVSEPQAVVSLFGRHAQHISLNSTKSMTGHMLGAAGAVEAMATILALHNGIVPPTINHFTDDPNIPDLDFTFNHSQRRDIEFALSNAFGFGGHNVCLAFKKYLG